MNQNPVIPVPVEFQGELLPGVEVVPYKDDRHGGYKVTVNDEDLVKEEIAKEYVVPPGTPILPSIVMDMNNMVSKVIFRAFSVGDRRIDVIKLEK